MERTPVTSSQIKSIGHDGENNLLEVEFNPRPGSDQPGSVYQYQNFTADKHGSLMKAESKGSHFGKHVKGVHPFRKQNADGSWGPWRS